MGITKAPPGDRAPATELIAWNLRKFRVLAGLSQDALATAADVDRTYIGRLERSMENPSIAVLEKLANSCGIHVSSLVSIPDPLEPPTWPMRAGRKATPKSP